MNENQDKNQLETLQKLAHIGLWEYNLKMDTLTWTDEIYNIFELDKDSFILTYENFLSIVHPDDRKKVEETYLNSVKEQKVLVLFID